MNAILNDDHASIAYYDSDYPARDGPIPSNFDATTKLQGLAADVDRYLGLAAECGGPVLDLCCGSGRVGCALARAGHGVVGVDTSQRMLEGFARKLAAEPSTAARVELIRADITEFDARGRTFPLIIIPFNSLLCITERQMQQRALDRAAACLSDGGMLVVDAVNPLVLPLHGDPVPKPFFTRRKVSNGALYTRFAALGPFDVEQKQELFGWYDEMSDDGTVRRTPYSMHWRPIFRFELELMIEKAGLKTSWVEGGHRHEPWTANSRKIFLAAKKGAAR